MPADNKQSRNTPAFGQACVLLFSTVLPFPVASQTQSTYSRRWTDVILFKFFLLKEAKHLPHFHPASLGANKKMESRNEWPGRGKWIMRLSRSIHPSHSTTCIRHLPLFKCSPGDRIHQFPAHCLQNEEDINSFSVKSKSRALKDRKPWNDLWKQSCCSPSSVLCAGEQGKPWRKQRNHPCFWG